MLITNFPEYARQIQAVINELTSTGEARLLNLQIDARSNLRGYIAGLLQFQDGADLHFREFVDVSQPDPRLMYAYHYQDAYQKLIFRYDNARHRPALSQPEHKHTLAGIESAAAPSLSQLLDEILQG
ncbi:MAG: hypothetical protein Fur0021_32860 [Candidatus Promineifilaceae bacterium]